MIKSHLNQNHFMISIVKFKTRHYRHCFSDSR